MPNHSLEHQQISLGLIISNLPTGLVLLIGIASWVVVYIGFLFSLVGRLILLAILSRLFLFVGFIVWMVAWLTGWLVGWLAVVNWLAGPLDVWLVD